MCPVERIGPSGPVEPPTKSLEAGFVHTQMFIRNLQEYSEIHHKPVFDQKF